MSIPYVLGISEKIKRVCYKECIHVVFRSGKTLRSILTHVKPKLDDNNLPGVIYKIPCLDCNCSYTGETGRTLQVRIGEHKRHCRNLDTSKFAVAQHTLEEGHRIDWSGSKVIDKETNWHTRRIKEAIHIRRILNFNQDEGLAISPIWTSDIVRRLALV